MTLRARVWLGLGAVLLALAAMGVLVWHTLGEVGTTRTEATDRIYPAAQATGELLAGVSDAESGVWGYAISGDRASLTQYFSGELVVDESFTALDQALTGPLADLRPLYDQAAEEWQQWRSSVAVEQIKQIAAGQAAAVREGIAEGQGDRLLGRLRVDAALLQQGLDERAQEAVALISQSTRNLALALMATGALTLAIAVAAALGLHRWVLSPLSDLGGQMRRIARDNDLVTPLEPNGPPEIDAVGHDAELLRQHLAERASAALQATEGLAQQGPTVAALRSYILGPENPELPGYGLGVASLSAAGALTADWWDVVPIVERRTTAVMMCDVSGHDTASALVAAHFKTALRISLGSGLPTQDALASAGRLLVDFPGKFASILLVEFGAAGQGGVGGIAWLNAGHEPPLLLRSNGYGERLRSTGPVASALGGDWGREHTSLASGDVVIMFTDGLHEARSSAGEEVGEERVAAWASALAEQSRGETASDRAGYLAQGLLDRSRAFAGDARRDDVTVLVAVKA